MSYTSGHYQQVDSLSAPPPEYASVLNDGDEEALMSVPVHSAADRFNFGAPQTSQSSSSSSSHASAHSSSSISSTSASAEKPRYRDMPFAVMFVGHLLLLAVACYIYGRRFAYEGGFSTPYSAEGSFAPSARFILTQLLVSAVTGAVAAFFWIELIKAFPTGIMHISLGCFLASLLAFAVYSLIFTAISWVHAVVLTAATIITVIYFYANRSRFPLAIAMLHASAQALSANSGPVFTALVLAAAQVLWALVWGVSAVFILSAHGVLTVGGVDPDLHPASAHAVTVVFALLLSFFWTWQVVMNVGHTTTAGAVAAWWLLPGYSRDSTTLASLRRALTTSFGSVCLGSLVVAVVSALRSTVRFFVKEDETSFAQFCLNCLLVCIERALEYFNHYAFTFVAVYGDSFIEAGAHTSQLFERRGFTLMINDDISSLPLQLGTAVCGIVTALVAASLALLQGAHGGAVAGAAVLALLLGSAVAAVVLEVVRSALSCTFVLWAELPAEMAEVQPEAFRAIANAQKAVYGGESSSG